jgi:hypothetical protein
MPHAQEDDVMMRVLSGHPMCAYVPLTLLPMLHYVVPYLCAGGHP